MPQVAHPRLAMTHADSDVDIQASHFTSQSSNNATYVIPDAPDSFPVSLASDGDLPLNITSTVAAITFNSYYDNGTGTVTAATGKPTIA